MTETAPAATTSAAAAYHDDHRESREFAEHHGLTHETGRRELVHLWTGYPFGIGNWRRAHNVVHGELAGRSMTAFEYHYVTLSDADESYDRDALHRFLVAVIDLGKSVPKLSAVRSEWLEWHEDAVDGTIIEVDEPGFTQVFTLFGDSDFGTKIITAERAAACAERHARAEWRFDRDQLLVWVRGGHVGEQLHRVLEAVGPIIDAADSYT